MKALSIRQPWAWFILSELPWAKRYENRQWNESYLRLQLGLCPIGSNFLIHAAKGMTKAEFDEACVFAETECGVTMLPKFDELKRGGIVGMAKLAGVVKASKDPWFTGPIALKMEDVYPLPFIQCQGALGFFEILTGDAPY